MRTFTRMLAAVMAVGVLAACDAGGTTPSAGPQPATASTSPATAPRTPTPSASVSCALESQPRRLLRTDDGWSAAELDAWSQNAYQLDETCDSGPEWPQDCDLFADLLLEGWPGYRTEGVSSIAGLSLLNTSGLTIEERVLLFRSPGSNGRSLLAEQAKACKATQKSLSKSAVLHEFPAQNGKRRFLVIDQVLAIQLTVPEGFNATKLIETARRRAEDGI
ncbi:hypothetical protein [Actinoplanes sp. NPDC026670]|uniref:hypothetical protein n=1 Tax=Actinoplanes sp. NPDC026670 TaxID=3154700 RepID=UPI0033DBC4B5